AHLWPAAAFLAVACWAAAMPAESIRIPIRSRPPIWPRPSITSSASPANRRKHSASQPGERLSSNSFSLTSNKQVKLRNLENAPMDIPLDVLDHAPYRTHQSYCRRMLMLPGDKMLRVGILGSLFFAMTIGWPGHSAFAQENKPLFNGVH